MKALLKLINSRPGLFLALFPISAGMLGCVRLSPDIISAPDKIRSAVQSVTTSDEHQIRALTNIDAQHFDEFERLLLTYIEMCKKYRREAIDAARQRVLENFDDAAFRLINSGLDAELGSNLPYQKLAGAELDARNALDQAIVTEKQHGSDPNARNARLKREQDWENTLRVLISTQNGLRADLIVKLAESRESFRATVDKTFDQVAADERSIPVLPPYQASAIEDAMDAYLKKAQDADSSIDKALVDLSAALEFSTKIHLIQVTKFVEGAGDQVGKELGGTSLIAALAGQALGKNAPDLVSDIAAAEKVLKAQAQSSVDKTAKDTAAAAAAKAAAAPAAQPPAAAAASS